MSHHTVWDKLELLRRHPNVHAGIINRFGLDQSTTIPDDQLHELSRHVEDCFRWFWPISH